MRKNFIIGLSVACLAAATIAAVASVPVVGKFRNRYSGVVASYVAKSGTNSVLNIPYTNDVPFRLAEVSATTNGIPIPVVVSRVWAYQRDFFKLEVITNMFDQVITNSYYAGKVVENVTNVVYDSESDTLPVNWYFMETDYLQADFGDVTNVLFRYIGTAD